MKLYSETLYQDFTKCLSFYNLCTRNVMFVKAMKNYMPLPKRIISYTYL